MGIEQAADKFRGIENVSKAIGEVLAEISRQGQLKASGKFLWTCLDNAATRNGDSGVPVTNAEKLTVLAEEFGEVSKEVVDEMIALDRCKPAGEYEERIRKELIQVAAVAITWAASLSEQGEST